MTYVLPSRRLVSQNESAMIENARVPRSKFIGSWTRKTAFNAGYLVPFLVDEILPGDHMTYDVTAYIRMSTPLFPLMDNQRIDTHIFFVPNRILWTNWTKFMGAQSSPGDSIDYTVPQLTGTTGGAAVNSLTDHLGVPFLVGLISATSNWTVNVLPYRAYNKIYNAWFRDENIINGQAESLGDGPDAMSQYSLQRRAKQHDYFTSALPWPQKFTAPLVPLSGYAPVVGIGALDQLSSGGPANVYETPGGAAVAYAQYKSFGLTDAVMKFSAATGGYPQIYTDLSQATGVAINTFRQAFMVQSLLERDARGGTRYTEVIRSHFGVTNPDFRLQRPEYIGGGQTPLQITPIAQTAPTTGVPLGALGAAGTATGGHRASYAATEHGYVIGIISVRTELSYQRKLEKHWSRSTRYDYFWPELSQLGEQAILRKEIYAQGTDGDDTNVFGYQERWHEYRTRVSEVTGIMRSGVAGTLDAWHLGQAFTSAPTLNSTFIQDIPPMARVLAAGALSVNQEYIADILINRTAVRPIPTFGTPATLGRF